MTTLITGGNGLLANSLKTYIDGDFYGKDMLDVTDANCINNLPNYDILIHTATGNRTINDNIPLLLTKAKKIFVFTSKQGTFLNWKQPSSLDYGLEKLTLNFTIYRHNLENHNAQTFEPGHMEAPEQYYYIAKKFSELYLNWKFEKNMIYDLSTDRYIPY